MPPHARAIVAKSALRFYGTTMGVLGLVTAFGAAIGASVNWDDDDSDFLKIKIGNAHYDIFSGELQAAKAIIKLVHSAIRGNRVPGEFADDVLGITGRFLRGKLSPVASLATDVFFETDYIGNKTELVNRTNPTGYPLPGKAIWSRLVPLTIGDIAESYKVDGIVGVAKSTPFAFFGVGVQTYKPRPEMPQTEAEKLAAKAIALRMKARPNTQTDEQKETRKYVQELTARSRNLEDVGAETEQAFRDGRIDKKQKKAILAARTKTYLEDRAEDLTLDEFEAVYKAATPTEKRILTFLLNRKMKDAGTRKSMEPEQKARLEQLKAKAAAK